MPMTNFQKIIRRCIWTTGLFLCIRFMGFSQNQPDEPDYQEKLNIKHPKPLNVNYYTGTNILFSKRYGSASNIYFGAGASYTITPRFTMEVGSTLNFSRLTDIPSGLYTDNQLYKPNLQTTSITLYTKGSYFLSSKLTLSGMAFKRFSPYNYPAVNPYFANHNQEGMSFELNYRLFQNFHIGAQFNVIQNNSSFYPLGLTQPGFDGSYR